MGSRRQVSLEILSGLDMKTHCLGAVSLKGVSWNVDGPIVTHFPDCILKWGSILLPCKGGC